MLPSRFSRGTRTRRIVQLLIIGLLATISAWSISLLNIVDGFERSTLDMRFRLFPSVEDASDEIVLVLLDGGSMDQLPWPVPRILYSDVLGLLQEWGAKAVGFDILFDLPSVYSATEDSIFGCVASQGSTAYVMALLQREGGQIPSNALIEISGNLRDLDTAWAGTPPNSMIARGAAILGSSNDRQDPDGVFRSIRLLTETPEGVVPSLPVAMAWLTMGEPDISVSPGSFTIGDNTFATDVGCRLQLRFHGPEGTYRSVPLADLTAALSARAMGEPCPIDSAIFNDATVLIGYAAPALYDLKPTPYSPRCPGVEVLATAIDNLISGDSVRRPSAWFSFLSALLISMLSAFSLSAVKKIPLGAVLAAVPPLILVASAIAVFSSGIWLDLVWPLSASILTILAGGIFLFSSENRRKQEIRTAFSQYLSPDVVSHVTAHPETLVLGGDRRVMTTFFSDIWGFTSISETLTPEELVRLLNRYLTTMTDIILETGGTVDKFEGDAIVAFWGAPILLDDHARRGCIAALRCQREHVRMNMELADEGFPELVTRIGLSTGDMVVGNMGSSRRFDYTVMGSTVNLGSRLEGANKVYGTSIMVPETTVSEVGKDCVFRELDTIRVVGQKTPVRVSELVCEKDELTEELRFSLDEYARALKLYRNGKFKEAATVFQSVSDPPSLVMAHRCSIMSEEFKGDIQNWDGIFDLSSK